MENKDFKPFPQPLCLRKLIGPSFIILALGLGSGEVILWPYLSSNYGLGLAWGALLGITLQFFINMEIERYALVKGESVFVGIAKIFPRATYWFIASTFIGFVLSLGKTVYDRMETITKTIILVGVPFIFILAIMASSSTDWSALASGA